jgi:hypothetical protein
MGIDVGNKCIARVLWELGNIGSDTLVTKVFCKLLDYFDFVINGQFGFVMAPFGPFIRYLFG